MNWGAMLNGNRPRWFRVTDPDMDAPDGAVVDGYERIGDRWVRISAKADDLGTVESAPARRPSMAGTRRRR